jgi:2-keto-3-deoxy-L-rhamnonate aldolase RhmA
MFKPLRQFLSGSALLSVSMAAALAASSAVQAQERIDITGWATGNVQPVPIHEGRPWGWAVRDYMDNPDRKLYNTAKAKLLAGEQIFSHSISTFDIERYCAEAPDYDYTWFEMQHSMLRYDEVAAMLAACPNVGATPILRLPDALEGSVQKAMDMGMLGIIVPTVNDAIQAREAARYARYPPIARRSAGGGQGPGLWAPFLSPGETFRESANDNMLVVVMIETVEGVNNAHEIASVPGVDVVLLGNADLSGFSGLAQDSPEYRDLQIRTRNATYRAGKIWANASTRMAEGNPLAHESLMYLLGPSISERAAGAR